MKKIIFALAALAAISLGSCNKKDDTKNDPKVTIAGNGFDIDKTIPVTTASAMTTPVKVDIVAEGGIENLIVDIESTSAAFNETLTPIGLSGEFDLANPGALAELFTSLGLQNGAAVKGKPTLTFDITGFVPTMAAFIPAGDFNAEFRLTVKNPTGQSATRTVKMSFTAGEAI